MNWGKVNARVKDLLPSVQPNKHIRSPAPPFLLICSFSIIIISGSLIHNSSSPSSAHSLFSYSKFNHPHPPGFLHFSLCSVCLLLFFSQSAFWFADHFGPFSQPKSKMRLLLVVCLFCFSVSSFSVRFFSFTLVSKFHPSVVDRSLRSFISPFNFCCPFVDVIPLGPGKNPPLEKKCRKENDDDDGRCVFHSQRVVVCPLY